MAEGTANKLFVVPSELQSIASLGATFSAAGQNGQFVADEKVLKRGDV